jgi:hypothetical protein
VSSTNERASIRDLLPTHRALLQRHRDRLVELMNIAVAAGLAAIEMSFILTDLGSHFGVACLAEGAGREFVVSDRESEPVILVPLGVNGLLVILAAMLPEAVDPVLTRPPGAVPVLIVDADDEPAVALLDVSKLIARSCS